MTDINVVSAGFRMNSFGQRGAVLLVGMIVLLVLTLIGTSSMGTVTLSERMVSNMQNANKAFQGAEAVLSECEDFVRGSDFAQLENELTDSLSDLASRTHRIIDVGVITGTKWWDDDLAFALYGTAATASGLTKTTLNPDGLVEVPRCITEYVGNGKSSQDAEDLYAGAGTTPGDKLLYRVTGFSKGADASSETVVESLFYKN